MTINGKQHYQWRAVDHDTSQYANNRAELSHQPTGVRERGMRARQSNIVFLGSAHLRPVVALLLGANRTSSLLKNDDIGTDFRSH